jgi:branched-chain amino acid transport system substrate-binding protein
MAGFDGWDDAQVPTLAAGALEGGIYCSRPGFALPDAQAFAAEYKAKFNIDPEAEALYGWDGLNWVVQCIKQANSTDPTVIRDALENTTSFEGLLGPMSVDPKTHNPSRELAIFKVVGDKEVYQDLIK